MRLLYSDGQPHSMPLVLSWVQVQGEVLAKNPYPGTSHDEEGFCPPYHVENWCLTLLRFLVLWALLQLL